MTSPANTDRQEPQFVLVPRTLDDEARALLANFPYDEIGNTPEEGAGECWAGLLRMIGATPPPCGGEAAQLVDRLIDAVAEDAFGGREDRSPETNAARAELIAALASTPAQAVEAVERIKTLKRFRTAPIMGVDGFVGQTVVEAPNGHLVNYDDVCAALASTPAQPHWGDLPADFDAAPAGQAVTEAMVDAAMAAAFDARYNWNEEGRRKTLRVALEAALTPPAGEGDGNV